MLHIVSMTEFYFNLLITLLMMSVTVSILVLMVKRSSFKQLPGKIKAALMMNLTMQLMVIYMMILVYCFDGMGWVGEGYEW